MKKLEIFRKWEGWITHNFTVRKIQPGLDIFLHGNVLPMLDANRLAGKAIFIDLLLNCQFLCYNSRQANMP